MAYENLNLLFIILILLINKVVNGQKFIPGPREGSTSILLGDKIYYIGGYRRGIDLTASDFFYFSLEKNFSWVDLKSQGVKFPFTAWHTSDIGGANQDSIFIIGGHQLETTSLVYKFDTRTNAITAPIIQGITPPRREDIRSVSYGGKIYIFGGRTANNSSSSIFIDNFDILDTVNMNWIVGSLVNAPIPIAYYTATLVNGVIYYIGGVRQTETSQLYVLMSDIYQYDIIGNTWTLKIATAARTLPGERIGHSAVLINGKICIYGEICIYGGIYFPSGKRSMSSSEQIAMLDTTTLAWSIPSLQNLNIPSLVDHTATLIDKRMLLAFGNVTNLPGGPVNNDKFYLFDFSEQNIKWDSFTALELGSAKASQSPTGTTSSNANKTENPQSPLLSKTVVVVLSVGLVALVAASLAGIVLIYKHKKKNKRRRIW